MECLDLFVRYASLTGPNRKRAMQADLSALRTSLQAVRVSALQEGKQAKCLVHLTVPAKELSVVEIGVNGIYLSGILPGFMEGEQCTIITSDERMYTGTLRKCATGLSVRLDEKVSTVEDITKLGIQVGDWVEADPNVHVTQSRFIKARNLRAISNFVILICALEMLLENGRTLSKETEFCINFAGEETGCHECWGISGGTYCPEDFAESLRIGSPAITAENGLDEYSVAIQGESLERIAKEKNIPYKVISGMGKGNILAAAFQVDGFSERGHEEGIKAAFKLLSAFLSE
ncbi:MAG TPA: M42 family metallopeptidase [Clostridiaceae bacterium]|nr:M42 family metallopeptidase [Clostridiaceae bacterium]